MKSLNEPYAHGAFHEQLVALAGVTPSSRVLDVGCGVGRTLRHAARIAEKVVGIDCNEGFLERARISLGDVVGTGRVELQNVDVDRERLPFQDGHFDNVVCQNVLECIREKTAFIQECRRVLKRHGVFLLGHHDFGGVLLNHTDPRLTRKIIAAYADEKQDWMASPDGEIGRKLPGFMRSANFAEAVTETRQFVDLGFGEDTYAREYCERACEAALRANLRRSDVDDWTNGLVELDRRGGFYFSIPWIYVRAIK